MQNSANEFKRHLYEKVQGQERKIEKYKDFLYLNYYKVIKEDVEDPDWKSTGLYDLLKT